MGEQREQPQVNKTNGMFPSGLDGASFNPRQSAVCSADSCRGFVSSVLLIRLQALIEFASVSVLISSLYLQPCPPVENGKILQKKQRQRMGLLHGKEIKVKCREKENSRKMCSSKCKNGVSAADCENIKVCGS